MPPEVLDRRKHGFSTPYDDWFRTALGGEVERRFAPGSELATLIDPRTVGRLVDGHRTGRADNKNVLFCLMELSEWHRAFIVGAGERPVAAAAARP